MMGNELAMRLHLMTADDIRMTARAFLTQHDHFAAWPADDRQALISSIVERANVVFLWVKGALQGL